MCTLFTRIFYRLLGDLVNCDFEVYHRSCFLLFCTCFVTKGPGTGIAPMRALLQERKFQGASSNGNNKSGKNTLYFGCKNRDVDYLYRNEIEEYHENNTVSSLHLAFSREQTHKVREISEDVCVMLHSII